MRIGHGYDIHRLAPGRRLILGGVEIAHDKGLSGHSDADALIHAVCDALLGAAALGDIGAHFPDDDDEYRGLDSRILLRRVVAMLRAGNRAVANIDITILAEAPKMAPHLAAMRAILAEDLQLPEDAINIKATTAEGLGAIGRGEGIAVHALALTMPSAAE